jgi:FkbM family methyltransferase
MRMVWPDGQGVLRREGVLFLLDLNTSNDKIILREGLLEPQQRGYFFTKAREKKCDTFLDIGANIGLYSIFATQHESFSTIIAFEPNQRCHDRLRANLLLNGLTDKVQTRRAAVSDRSGTVSFIYCPKNNDLFSQVTADGGSEYSVPAVRLDDELPFTGHRIAIKMDIEGHEMAALEGMKNLLRTNDCFLQVECWKENAARVIAAMQAEGYRLIHIIKEDHYFEIDPASRKGRNDAD